jgi:hypothetical protein
MADIALRHFHAFDIFFFAFASDLPDCIARQPPMAAATPPPPPDSYASACFAFFAARVSLSAFDDDGCRFDFHTFSLPLSAIDTPVSILFSFSLPTMMFFAHFRLLPAAAIS